MTVWTTAGSRPLCIIKNAFKQSVSDLSWSADGSTLVAASLDGTVAFFRFERCGEVGDEEEGEAVEVEGVGEKGRPEEDEKKKKKKKKRRKRKKSKSELGNFFLSAPEHRRFLVETYGEQGEFSLSFV